MSVVMVWNGCALPLWEWLHPVMGHGKLLEVIIILVVERVTGGGVPA
jgi:hypothetical protein